jgi:hypothetical protein
MVGAASLSVCSHLPLIANSKLVGEVAAGSSQVWHEAAPERIGHLHTIGSVVDCLRSCESTGELLTMITSGPAATTAAASPRRRSGSSVAQR